MMYKLREIGFYLLLIATPLAISLAIPQARANQAIPNPQLQADEVVRLQLSALRDNDRPHADAGIATVWAFTSPANKANTGPLPRFVEMVHAGYEPMLNHQQAELLPTLRHRGQVLQRVIITARDGRRIGYVFSLSQYQTPECAACWMTDAVVLDPVQPEQFPMV